MKFLRIKWLFCVLNTQKLRKYLLCPWCLLKTMHILVTVASLRVVCFLGSFCIKNEALFVQHIFNVCLTFILISISQWKKTLIRVIILVVSFGYWNRMPLLGICIDSEWGFQGWVLTARGSLPSSPTAGFTHRPTSGPAAATDRQLTHSKISININMPFSTKNLVTLTTHPTETNNLLMTIYLSDLFTIAPFNLVIYYPHWLRVARIRPSFLLHLPDRTISETGGPVVLTTCEFLYLLLGGYLCAVFSHKYQTQIFH